MSSDSGYYQSILDKMGVIDGLLRNIVVCVDQVEDLKQIMMDLESIPPDRSRGLRSFRFGEEFVVEYELEGTLEHIRINVRTKKLQWTGEESPEHVRRLVVELRKHLSYILGSIEAL